MKETESKRERNKAVKKEAFLSAAERLFILKGFENTSMDEVAKEAGLTKRTLYQYFLSKEDLFYAIAVRGAQQLYEASMEAFDQGDNAREKIRLANIAHLRFYTDSLNLFQMLNYQPANRENCEASPYYRKIGELDGMRMMHLASLMGEGRTDGSINPTLDMKKAVVFGFFAPFSMLFTFASMDKGVWEKFQMDEGEFLRFSFDLMMDALK